MSEMVKRRAAELEGAQLDWAVAMAGEEWRTAHRHFPTMTLDPTFAGVYIIGDSAGVPVCVLRPNNPFRQGPQEYNPSADWMLGGPIIERDWFDIVQRLHEWYGFGWVKVVADAENKLALFMRAFVASKLGDEVEVPE